MNKNKGMLYALGEVKGYLECEKDYKTVKLGDLFGEKYNKYELGLSNGIDMVCIYDVSTRKANGTRRRVIEVDRHFYIDALVYILNTALAEDLKLEE